MPPSSASSQSRNGPLRSAFSIRSILEEKDEGANNNNKEDDISDVARFMPRVYEEDDVDVDGANDDLDASNEEEVNVKEVSNK